MKIATYLLCLVIVLLPGCGTGMGLSTEQRDRVLLRSEGLHDAGAITKDELAGIRAFLERDLGGRTTEDLLWTISGIIGSIFGVYLWRGSTTHRKGLLPPADPRT